MSTKQSITYFSDLLSRIAGREIKTSADELDDMIHFIFTGDRDNISLYEDEELKEILEYLLVISQRNQLTSIESLQAYYKSKTRKILGKLNIEVPEENKSTDDKLKVLSFCCQVVYYSACPVPFYPAYSARAEAIRQLKICVSDHSNDQVSRTRVTSSGDLVLCG
ncbi:MAG: hypothetical protein Q8N05_21200 [Bacteroidota bacterium]|nr:hypothetical protein [Bacteroidota bacterium]